MMAERHYDEESLIALLHAGEESASRDPHLADCTTCSDMLASYRAISEILGEAAVWDLSDQPSDQAIARGAASLRAFASSIESEDQQAISLIDELLLSPRQWWIAKVTRDERFHTAGVVRRLIEISEIKIDTMPPEAVELAFAAIAVTEKLGESDHILSLRGAAFRQHAYSLFIVGEFMRALESVERAQQAYERCFVSEYGLARLDIVRALVYRALERFGEALKLARKSSAIFRTFGDTRRLASAMMTEGYLLMQQHNYREALPVFVEVEERYSIDLDTRMRAVHNKAICQKSLGRVADALQSYQFAAELCDELGAVTDGTLIKYNVAVLLAAEGKQAEGRRRMRELRAEFERLGMLHNAVEAGLDLAEFAALEHNFEEVEELCRTAMRQFETAGVPHSSEALTALTFLREAAEQRRATQEIVWHVRTYIKRLPDEPALLFAPAPLPPA